MLLRPTIPVSDWRIATHLEATRALQRRASNPAEGCDCTLCQHWAKVATTVLPLDLQKQLHRFGIDLEHPADVYASSYEAGGAHCRVIFHVVGKLLSGPQIWMENLEWGRSLNYKELRPVPQWLGLAVLPAKEFRMNADPDASAAGDILQIDLRLFVAGAVK
jgi:hypothetical protein